MEWQLRLRWSGSSGQACMGAQARVERQGRGGMATQAPCGVGIQGRVGWRVRQRWSELSGPGGVGAQARVDGVGVQARVDVPVELKANAHVELKARV